MGCIDTSKHIITLFLEQVKATPDAPALEDPDRRYTYAELDKEVTSLALRLRSNGVNREKMVGILLPHTADFIIACLAALRAGGAYLILELAYPPQLLNDVIQHANPPVLITYKAQVKNINPGTTLIVLDEEEPQTNGYHGEEATLLPTEYDRDQLAFVSYSSGTTGLPKGIANHDRPGVLSYDQRFAISDQKPTDRIACNTFFIWEMFRPFTRGACAFAVPDEASYDPIALVDLLASENITETLMTPTLLASILAAYPDAGSRLPELRVLWITGEVVTTDLARRSLKILPNTRILNSYSTSETWDTAIGDMKDVLHDADQSMYCSVGAPLGVNTIYILDENGNRLEPGNSGEIFIGGPVLALGYLNLPDVTARTFVPDPFSSEPGARMYRSGDLGRILPSGSLEITGRIGTMIKLRGYTVVPAKVQIAIVTHLAIKNCAVVSYGDGLERQLVAYFVRDGDVSIDRPVIEVDNAGYSPAARRILSEYLAPYMIPAYWVEMSALPANPVSGKIDTKRLPLPPIATKANEMVNGTKLVNGTEKETSSDINIDVIAHIWASTLNIPRSIITTEHNFFDLGGHSLSLAKLSTNFTTQFGFRVPVARLVDPPTLQGHLETVQAFKDGHTAAIQAELPTILRSDCVLEDDIQPTNTKMCKIEEADTILLTGVTGFLGAFLLHDLLKGTKGKIICLVRSNETSGTGRAKQGAKARIRVNLVEKGLWTDSFMERIEVLPGDLTKQNFGMSTEAFTQAASRIQVIIHAGATVNLVYPYATLRAANVGGTREILRLASLSGATVQYVSTNSVLPPSVDGWSEDTNLIVDEVIEKLPAGYDQTKWVAEQLVREASNRGLPVRIIRAGTISGHSTTGVTNSSDLLTALIVESLELGYAPEVEGWLAEMTPIDYLSKTIIHLANQAEAKQLVFHLGDPKPVEAKSLFQDLKTLGYPTQSLNWDEWVAKWTEKRSSIESDGSTPVDILRSAMPPIDFLTGIPVLGNPATKKYHQGITRPEINTSLLETYTRHWFAQDWISKPPSRQNNIDRAIMSGQTGPLAGLVAVITGASSGIGAATATALAKEGAHIAIAARRTEALESLKTSLEQYGGKVLVHQTDVTDRKQVESLMAAATDKLGPIDILVACAGVMYYTLMANIQTDEWERTVDVNCKGVLHCLSTTVPGMLSRGKGHIIAISSDAGRKVFPGLGVYSASKFFVEATLQTLRLETVGKGLRVTSIQPGNTATELLGISTDKEAIKKYGEPSGAKVLDPEDVAGAIVYALKQPEQVSVNEILIQPRDEPI